MDWKSLLDANPDQLHKSLTAKEKKVRDPMPGQRKRLITSLERAKAAHAENKQRSGIFKRLSKDGVGNFTLVTLKANKRVMPLNGAQFGLVPDEYFEKWATGFAEHVNKGGYDAELKAAYAGGGETPKRTRRSKAEMAALRAAGKAK